MVSEVGEKAGEQDAMEICGREYFEKVVVNAGECCCQEED